ncbi:MAG TPA: FxsA family protein [Devosiaceae bacterium]
MGRLLFATFLVVPLIEIGLFINIGQIIGLWPTLLGVVLTAMIGSWIVRQQGLSLVAEINRQMRMGQLPARQLADGMMIGIAGALLITPGYFTDTCGFLLLVPAVRSAIYAFLKSRITVVDLGRGPAGNPRGPHDSRTIDLDEDDWRD